MRQHPCTPLAPFAGLHAGPGAPIPRSDGRPGSTGSAAVPYRRPASAAQKRRPEPTLPHFLAAGLLVFFGTLFGNLPAAAQDSGVLRGTVTFADSGAPVTGALVRVAAAGVSTTTGEDGAYEIPGLPPGSHEVVVEHGLFTGATRTVTVAPGAAVVADFQILAAVQERVQVTADLSGYRAESAVVGRTAVALLDTPASIQVIGRDLLEDQVVSDSEEVYRNIAGVTSSPYASVVARGFTQRDFVFNGVRGNPYGSLGGDVNASGFSVSQLQLSNIERIEILKGPASVLYGSTEPGGVVNFVTAQPQEEFGVRGTFRFGQFDQIYGSGEVTGPLGDSKRLLYRFAAYGNERNSFRSNASMRNVHLVGNLVWRPTDRAEFSFDYENLDQDLAGHRLRGVPVNADGEFLTDTSWTATEPTDFTKLDADVFQVRWNQVFARDWTLDATLRYLEYDREQEYHEPRRVTPENTMRRHFRDQTRTNDDVSFVLNVHKVLRAGSTVHRLLFGTDVFRQDHAFRYGRAREVANGGPVPDIHLFDPQYGRTQGSDYGLDESTFPTDTAVARQVGFYVQDHLDLGSALHLVAGGRYNTYDDSGEAGGDELRSEESGFTGRLGVVYKPQADWSLYGSWSNSFNRPSVLAQTPNANGPHDPETAVQFEIGAKTEFLDDLSLTAALFTITKSNVLRPDPDFGPNGNNYNAALQVGEARNRGLEVELVGSITPDWQAAVNYTYLDSEIREDTNADAVGQPLPNAAPHSVGLFTRAHLFSGWSAGLGLTHIGERVEPYAGIRASAYTVVDLFAYRQLGRFARLQVKLENAFDTVYATSSLFSARAGNFPGQPRTLSVLVSFDGLR